MLSKVAKGCGLVGYATTSCDLHVEIPVAAYRKALCRFPDMRTEVLATEQRPADIGNHICKCERTSEPLVGTLHSRLIPVAWSCSLTVSIEPIIRSALLVCKLNAPKGERHTRITKIRHEALKEALVAEIITFTDPDQVTFGHRQSGTPLAEDIPRALGVVNGADGNVQISYGG